MSADLMDTEESLSVTKEDNNDVTMEDQCNGVGASEKYKTCDKLDADDESIWPIDSKRKLTSTKLISAESCQASLITYSNTVDSHKNTFGVGSDKSKYGQSKETKDIWSIRSPLPFRDNCSKSVSVRRKSNENNTSKLLVQDSETDIGKKEKKLCQPFLLSNTTLPSAFIRKQDNQSSSISMDGLVEQDSNALKRCNSAPLLNDADDNPTTWSRPVASSTGRTRRFSATVVSLNSSPASNGAKSRLRLHQLQKEESLEGIQNKETAHEREVQATIQISSNCGDLTLADRPNSLDGCFSCSPRSTSSPSHPNIKTHFPTPPSTLTGVGKSSHSRAIDFSASSHTTGGVSPTHPHYPSPHHPSSGGIPSPLTFSSSPYMSNLSPLPPSPTRGICGPGKQCFSPSMQVPVSLPRTASRSPSPSPTRRTFVTRRRSQSPCVMWPSALGPIKRKYDSDSEGSYSPKRIFLHHPNSNSVSGMSGDASHATSIATPLNHRTLIQRSHSLSSSSIDSSDLYVSPSPPHQASTYVPQHHNNHTTAGFVHPLHHTSTPMHSNGGSGSQITLDHPNRCSSPASSTCSSSSLEGLRDLQPLHTQQAVTATPKKS